MQAPKWAKYIKIYNSLLTPTCERAGDTWHAIVDLNVNDTQFTIHEFTKMCFWVVKLMYVIVVDMIVYDNK